MSKNTKRGIVVDGIHYKWVMGNVNFVVWDSTGKRVGITHKNIGTGGADEDYSITPFDAANWIRVNVQGKPAVQAPVVEKPVVPVQPRAQIPGEQTYAYALIAHSTWWDDDAGSSRSAKKVIEVSLDPSVPIDMANLLNEFVRDCVPKFKEWAEPKTTGFYLLDDNQTFELAKQFCGENDIVHPEALRVLQYSLANNRCDLTVKYESAQLALVQQSIPLIWSTTSIPKR